MNILLYIYIYIIRTCVALKQASLLHLDYYHFPHEYLDATAHGLLSLASFPVRHAYFMYAGVLGRNLEYREKYCWISHLDAARLHKWS